LIIIWSITFRVLNYNNSSVLYFHTFSVLIDLAVGGFMACLIKQNNKVRLFFENSSSLLNLTLLIFSICLVFWSDELFSFKFGTAIGRFFISTSFALVISAQALTKKISRFALGNFSFANKWGKYTYGIYLIHPIIITIIDVIARVSHFPKTNFACSFLLGVIGFILTLFFSKLIYRYYESKFLALKDRLFST
jgi:peptidoglycan/LPS O-acetylase OafA/YrhL